MTKVFQYIETESDYELYDEKGEKTYDYRIVRTTTPSARNGYRDSLARQQSIPYEQFEQSQVSNINDACFIFMIYTPATTFIEQYPNVTKGDYARLVYLSTFLQKDGTKIKKDAINYAKTTDIIEMLDAPKRTVMDFLKRCKSENIIFSDDEGYINISSEIFRNGHVGRRTKTRKFVRVYIDNTRHLYHAYKKGKAIEKLGTLYALVPYIDYKTNILCANANDDVKELSELIPLTKQDIAEILGHKDSKNVHATLKSLNVKIHGILYSLFMYGQLLGDKDKESYIISPFFVYADVPAQWLFTTSHLMFVAQYKSQVPQSLTDINDIDLIKSVQQSHEQNEYRGA